MFTAVRNFVWALVPFAFVISMIIGGIGFAVVLSRDVWLHTDMAVADHNIEMAKKCGCCKCNGCCCGNHCEEPKAIIIPPCHCGCMQTGKCECKNCCQRTADPTYKVAQASGACKCKLHPPCECGKEADCDCVEAKK